MKSIRNHYKIRKGLGLLLIAAFGLSMLTGCATNDEALSQMAYDQVRADTTSAWHSKTERTVAYEDEAEEVAPIEVWYVDPECWAYKTTWPEELGGAEHIAVRANGKVLQKWDDTEWVQVDAHEVIPPVSGNKQPEWKEMGMTLVSHEKKDDRYSITWSKEVDMDENENIIPVTWTFTFNEKHELVWWETQVQMPIESEVEIQAIMKSKTEYFSFDKREVQDDINAIYAEATKE